MELVPATKRGRQNQRTTTAKDRAAMRRVEAFCLSGDFAEIYHHHRRWALPLARYLGAGDDAEDVFHEAILSLLPHLDISSPAFGPFLAWRLSSRCSGAYRTKAKHQSRFVPLPEGYEDLFPGDSSEDPATDLWVGLHHLIDALPAAGRVLIRQVYWEDRSLAEVAKSLGMSEAAVKALVFRTRRKLGAQLRNHPSWRGHPGC